MPPVLPVFVVIVSASDLLPGDPYLFGLLPPGLSLNLARDGLIGLPCIFYNID